MILSYWDVLYFHVRTVSFREGIKLKKKGSGSEKTQPFFVGLFNLPHPFLWDGRPLELVRHRFQAQFVRKKGGQV